MIVDTDYCYYLCKSHRYYDTAHLLFRGHSPPIRSGTTSRNTVISCMVILVTWILGISLHGLLHFILAWTSYAFMSCLHVTVTHPVLFLFPCHIDHRAYYMYYCSMLPYSCYMIVSWYWYGYSHYWTWELLICNMWDGIPHLLFPFPVILFLFPVILFYAINRTQVQLSCYPYHVLYLFLLHCILDISDHKANLGMGETWRLIRSYRVIYWIHIVSPTAGDGSATYQLVHELPLLDSCSPLSGGPWSQQPGVRLRPWSRVCTGYTYPIRTPRPWVSN